MPKLDETKTGLPAALKNTAAGQERGGLTAGSAPFQQPALPQTPLGAKNVRSAGKLRQS
jgi:hypothetical protein